ncbi:MAG: hypothetical protein LBC53_09825 [Spirochaetaceae bacterium]|nr:hypothetical protein [Spirochaetaceae bacterium]
MDERVKKIRVLNDEISEAKQNVEVLLASLGKSLLEYEGNYDCETLPEIKEYKKLKQTIAETHEKILKSEEEYALVRRLESEILTEKREASVKEKSINQLYAEFGAIALEAEGMDCCAPARSFLEKKEALNLRINNLKKSAELINGGASEGGIKGFFTTGIKKIREEAALKTARSELKQLYLLFGKEIAGMSEKDFCAVKFPEESLKKKAEDLRSTQAGICAITSDIESKQTELDSILQRWKAGGGINVKLNALNNEAAVLDTRQMELCVKTGAEASNVQKKDIYSRLLKTSDLFIIENVQKETGKIAEISDKIKLMENSLQIDAKQIQIEKLEKQAAGKREQISKIEAEIMDIEKKISAVNAEISRVQQLD